MYLEKKNSKITDNKILTLIVLYVFWFNWIVLFNTVDDDEEDDKEEDEDKDDEEEDDEKDSWSLSIISFDWKVWKVKRFVSVFIDFGVIMIWLRECDVIELHEMC